MILEWLPTALRDFDGIIDHIAEDNPVAAVEQGDAIEQQVANLPHYLKLGRTGRVKGTRELIIARTPYIVVYRVKKDRILILRVLHGAMQWPSAF